MNSSAVPARLFDAQGILVVSDDHPLAWLRFRRHCRVRDLLMARERGVCGWCRDPGRLTKGRYLYHPECKGEVDLRWSPVFLRGEVRRRDQEICFVCGTDTSRLPRPRGWRHRWEAHHVLAVEDGGGCCGLANLITVCLKCHTDLGVAQAAQRAKRRRRAEFDRKARLIAEAQPGQRSLPW